MAERCQNSCVTSYRTTAKMLDVKGVYGLLLRMRCSHPMVLLQRTYWLLLPLVNSKVSMFLRLNLQRSREAILIWGQTACLL